MSNGPQGNARHRTNAMAIRTRVPRDTSIAPRQALTQGNG